MNECRWCGMIHGPRCPEVKAIEYFQDGTVKRVELLTPMDRMPMNGWPLPLAVREIPFQQYPPPVVVPHAPFLDPLMRTTIVCTTQGQNS